VMDCFAIDDGEKGVRQWEARFGTQVEHLMWVNERLPYDLFAKGGLVAPGREEG